MLVQLVAAVLPLAVAAAGLTSGPAAAETDRFKDLPGGWHIQKSFVAPRQQTEAIARKLGGRILALSNTMLSADGQRLQVNIFRCPTAQDADRLHETVLGLKGNPAYCIKQGTSVVEFVCDDIGLAKRAHYVLGYQAREVTYRVSFDAAPLEKCHDMSWNKLFNLFVALNENPDDQNTRSQIRELSKRFQFGKRIRLRTRGLGKASSTYSFTPSPAKTLVLAGGDITEYRFNELPDRAGVPYVSIVATVTAHAFAPTPAASKPGKKLPEATDSWPSTDPQIVALAKRITGTSRTDDEKVNAILQWMMPGANIEFGGPIAGSRYGVKATLKQGYGQCWDFSDCFVTLSRASGIPCRQVGGWLYGQCGHIWAEVLIDGKGWQQVDPTGGMACGSDYVPYLTTETGEMPMLYLTMPRIEIVSRK